MVACFTARFSSMRSGIHFTSEPCKYPFPLFPIVPPPLDRDTAAPLIPIVSPRFFSPSFSICRLSRSASSPAAAGDPEPEDRPLHLLSSRVLLPNLEFRSESKT